FEDDGDNAYVYRFGFKVRYAIGSKEECEMGKNGFLEKRPSNGFEDDGDNAYVYRFGFKIASRKERVPKTYDYRSQYDAHEYDTYHANYNIEMEDDTIDETYEPQGITMLDFDDEDEDEGEEQNEEFTLHSTNTMEWSAFGSCKDKEDADDYNNSFEDLISPIKEHDKESVPFKVREGVMEANTTPYLLTLKEPILSLIDGIRSKEDEEFLALSLYKDECLNLLEEVKVTHTDQTSPQMTQVLTNNVGMDDILIQSLKHEKARVGVRNLSQFVCHGKKDFGEVSNYDKLIKFASKRSRVKQVRSASNEEKGKEENLFPPLDNPELTIQRRSRTDPTLLINSEMAAEGNGDLLVPDLRTMKELCQPSLNGRGGPISLIAIQATNFGLKNDMIQQV
nr:reverse transcriptase domain-containing protein [Tanacetum cinerariifolium]